MPGSASEYVQSRFGSERGIESGAAPRHVTIGFPPDRGAWSRGVSPHRGVLVAFAGQGTAIWQTFGDSARKGREAQGAQRPGQWQVRFGELGRRNRSGFFGRRFRRHWFFGGNGFGFFGYPFYGYGPGLFSDCPDWLVPDWEWQEYDAGDCGAYSSAGSQNAAIVTEGADQGYSADQSYGVSQRDTQEIYGSYADRSSSHDPMAQGVATEADRSAAVSAANGAQQPDTLIYLSDGTNYAVTNYWLGGGALHYMTSYGAEDSVPIGQIDLQRTVDANAAQGVQFTLRPAPSASNSGSKR
jgi:hypothetical protein